MQRPATSCLFAHELGNSGMIGKEENDLRGITLNDKSLEVESHVWASHVLLKSFHHSLVIQLKELFQSRETLLPFCLFPSHTHC